MYKILNDDEANTKRVLRWFEKTGIGLIAGEEEIKTLTLSQLREIFDVRDVYDPEANVPYREDFDPYLYHRYFINEDQTEILQPHFQHHIDLNKYEYCISAYTRTT